MLTSAPAPSDLLPATKRFYDAIHKIRREDDFFYKQDFDPVNFGPFLSHICMMNVIPGQDGNAYDLEFALVSTLISDVLGTSHKGDCLTNVVPRDFDPAFWAILDDCYRQKAIRSLRVTLTRHKKDFLETELIYVPLLDETGKPSHFIILATPVNF